MKSFDSHLILTKSKIRDALFKLDKLAADAILFVVNHDNSLIGSLTDGDVRRGLLKNFTIDDQVDDIIQSNPKFIRKGEGDIKRIIEYREKQYKIIPILDEEDRVLNIINFRKLRSYLPVDAIIMAGGKGMRLRPLTENTPKPLLKIEDKPIVEYNLERLSLFGIDDFWFSINYLGEQIEDYFGDGKDKNIHIEYVWENEPLGTIGAVSKIENFKHPYVLVTNSDIITNLDYEHFFVEFLEHEADISVVTIPYRVNVPYAVLNTSNGQIHGFKEKPTYTYYSNGGIYLVKRELLKMIPPDRSFNATDLIEEAINAGKKVVSYVMSGYWIDVGKPEDFKKAAEDVKHIKF